MNTEQRKQIDELYFSLYDFLVCYAESSLGNEALAEEAVQETFAIACAKPSNVCESPNPRGWLVQTLKYVIANLERRRINAEKVVTDCLGERIDTLPAPPDQMDLRVLYGNVAQTEEFKLMLAISQEGKSLIEIAQEKGITVEACKKRAQRAKKVLKRRMR